MRETQFFGHAAIGYGKDLSGVMGGWRRRWIKNNFEDEFLAKQLKRNNLNIKFSYNKIKKLEEGRDLADSVNNLFGNSLNVIVYNFVDMLSHARTDMAMIRELAPDESAYRSITKSWFTHSPLFDILKKISEKK